MPLVASRHVANCLRLARRLGAGMSARRAAAAEGLSENDLGALLADSDFTDLVEACRRFDALPEDEAVERLVKLAYIVIEDALNRGHVMVGFYVVREHERGRNPARSLARSAVAARRRAVAQAAQPEHEPAEPPAPKPKRPASHPADRAARAAAARLRSALLDEAVLHEAVPAPAKPKVAHPSDIIARHVARCLASTTAPARSPPPTSRAPPRAA
jgi:hypothetical protein